MVIWRQSLSVLAAVAVAMIAVLASGGCGNGDAAPAASRPVDPALAPAEVLDGALGLYENTGDIVTKAFDSAGERSLLGENRLWEIRRSERLVGTLQVSTVVPRVELTDESQRASVVRDVLTGVGARIRVGDVEVHRQTTGGKSVYVWFGRNLVEILTIRETDEIKADDVLTDVITHQRSVSAWEPLPLEAEVLATDQ